MIAYMERKEYCAQVADLVVPVDDWELGKQSDCGDELIAQADEEREDYLQRLADRCEADDEWAGPWNGDPILIALEQTAVQIQGLQNLVYELIAYAREIPPPGRKYTFEQLAAAARMSVSGVRSCYTVGDISSAARKLVIGAGKRGASADRRWDSARVWRRQCHSKAMEDALDKLVAEGSVVAGSPEELRAGEPGSSYAIVEAFSTTDRAYLVPNNTLSELLGEELSRRPGLGGAPLRRPRRVADRDQPPF
ncbi:hypothetical protein MA6G0728R_5383 [Mycobacteroides abscessus 6G-0728-R]|nr:hypothetical protein MA6G0125S_5378 [Mycobacteroides abscessus 6G-0125-S]EIU64239.1 hypothetical protein MA6G0728S_5356 [Mycobacteroides abscessus 6G-0728-S]EIV03103.1 hypothetical protein MA6G0728R_5383 [Mycobacteroides abscessus 6G-0728-R]